MNQERTQLEKILQKFAKRSHNVPNLTHIGRCDPRARLRRLEELLKGQDYEGASKLAEELRNERIPFPEHIKEKIKEDLRFFVESRNDLVKSVKTWIKTKGRRQAKQSFYEDKELYITDFLYLKAETLLADLVASDNPPKSLCDVADEYLCWLEDQAEEDENELAEERKALEETRSEFMEMRTDALVDGLLKLAKQKPYKKLAITDYESQADWELLKPEFKELGITLEMEQASAKKAQERLKASGVELEIRMVNTSNYLRWLATNKLKNTQWNRAKFIMTPEYTNQNPPQK